MILYALLDKKSSVLDYFIGSCDEDAMRTASVMLMSSRSLFEFAEDFAVVRIRKLESSRELISGDEILIDCGELKRQIIERRKEQENVEN